MPPPEFAGDRDADDAAADDQVIGGGHGMEAGGVTRLKEPAERREIPSR